MSWKNVKLIFLREVRDQFRDRRTLFMIAILPLLLYPALGIGMMQMAWLFIEQPRTVVILGAEHLPSEPALLDGNQFVPNWFRLPQSADKLKVFTERDLEYDGEPPDPKVVDLFKRARQIRDKLPERDTAEKAETRAKQIGDQAEIQRQADIQDGIISEISRLMGSSLPVLIIVPEDFGENIAKANRQFAARDANRAEIGGYERPRYVWNRADEKSHIAYRRVKEALDNWEQKILEQRLKYAELPADFASPVKPDSVDVAQKAQLAASFWSKLFPTLLVIMAVTGAFYPAVDLAAGEKERGTMETLLICPATRSEIVLGKFLTVMLFSVATVILNLVSMALTGKYLASIDTSGSFVARFGDMSLPGPMALMWIVILLIPLAALFSALCLALATFARSSKEGQYYLTPLLMITLGLSMFSFAPGVEIRPFYSIMPVVGPSLLLKKLLESPGSTEPLAYAIPVLVTSVIYSLLALWWAIEQFSREDVLFRESERFEVRLWFRHLLRDKEPTPTFAEAGFCFVMIMLLQFFALSLMQGVLPSPGDPARATRMMQLLMVQQLVIIATPALFMGVILTSSVVRTFRIRLPNWRILAVAVVLPIVLHPLSLELSAVLEERLFEPFPDDLTDPLREIQALMTDPSLPWWLVFLALAVVPAICEETVFRGFLLSGFLRSRHVWLAIVLSSLAFGTVHWIPQQVFNATLLGLVLGLIVLRSNSLIPGIVFHMIYNSLTIMRGRIDPSWLTQTPVDWFLSVKQETIRYQWPTLMVAAVIAIVLLRWLVNQPNAGLNAAATGVSIEQSQVTKAQAVVEPPVGAG